MAHKKGFGFSCNGCDFNLKCFGVKVFVGQVVMGGEIIVCQCGMKFRFGDGVGIGFDDMIYVCCVGVVEFCEGWCGCIIFVLFVEQWIGCGTYLGFGGQCFV